MRFAQARREVGNTVAVTGGWHSTFVNDLRHDVDEADVPHDGPMIGLNPHIRCFDV